MNQSDDDEKGHQVQMMGDIYRSATQVYVWLGEEGNDSSFAMESIVAIHQSQHFNAAKTLALSDGSRISDRKYHLELSLDALLKDIDLNHVLSAVGHLTLREWWFRLWVVQEVALAKQVFLKSGKKMISWISFYNFALLCDWILKSKPRHPMANQFDQIRSQATMALVCSANIQNNHDMSLLYLLGVMSVIQKASDTRDRIYALLGMSSDLDRLGIEPEYYLPWVEVYINTAASLLRGYGLSILSYCVPWSGHVRDPRLPSWVPDWHVEIHRPLRGLDGSIFRYTAGGVPHTVLVTNSLGTSNILSIGGAFFDKISWLGGGVSEGKGFEDNRVQGAISVALRHFHEFYQGNLGKAQHPALPALADYEVEALWRTPIANQTQRVGAREPYRLAQSGDAVGYHSLLTGGMNSFSSEDTQVLDYCWSVWRKLPGRCLFATSCGYIGLGSRSIQPNDTVCVFQGADVPFILREKTNGRYELIGEAYIHGIMDGQFMKTNPEIRTFDVE
jgi:hypothetical protein